jgi:nicotinamide riboside transporter PnuC
MIDIIVQIAIFVFSALAIIFVARKNKWGFVFGLLSQPFWFIASYQNKEWGIFSVNIIYTFSWIYGIYQWFYNEK